MPKSNSQQKSTPDARTRHQQVGAERRGAGSIAKGKDRPEGPESSRRELFFKLWESEGKVNRPEHTAGSSQNKGTEKLQRRAAPAPLEVGGRGEGKGANSAPEKPPPPTLQTGPRFLSKDFLRPDRRRALGPRREKAQCAREEGTKPLAAWPEHSECSPHTATSACSVPPSP